MKLQAFYTTRFWDPVAFGIRSATAGAYSHVGPLFTASPEELQRFAYMLPAGFTESLPAWPNHRHRIYFESIGVRDKRTGKTGARGPYDFERVVRWAQVAPRRRALLIQDLPHMDTAETENAFKQCIWAVREIRYAHLQIARNWLGLRLGRGIPLRRRSPGRWTCVEMLVRILPPRIAVPVLRLGDILYDEYCPSGMRGPGVWEMFECSQLKGQTA